jgi:hypothetical protein
MSQELNCYVKVENCERGWPSLEKSTRHLDPENLAVEMLS